MLVISHRPEVEKRLTKAERRALTMVGMTIERFAKEEISKPKAHTPKKDGTIEIRPNVDTGLLRNSITFALSGESANIGSYSSDDGTIKGSYSGTEGKAGDKTVFVGTNVHYAPFVCLGTRTSPPYPFLRPAVENNREMYKAIIKGELKDG